MYFIILTVKLREMRVTQQSRDLNLAIVLISSVVMFLFCHTPRWYKHWTFWFKTFSYLRLVTSVYEAANIHSILHCREKGKDKTPLWFMYVTATVQFLMVTNKAFCKFSSHYFTNCRLLMHPSICQSTFLLENLSEKTHWNCWSHLSHLFLSELCLQIPEGVYCSNF